MSINKHNNYLFVTGRRKNATCSILYSFNSDKFLTTTINNKKFEEYFSKERCQLKALLPCKVTNTSLPNMRVKIIGGGEMAQASAMSHAISQLLKALNDEYTKILKPLKLLTRDDRRVERKKIGQPGARKKHPTNKR
ncbi:30S ribosomal protein S9 [Rickettsiales bacterium (ex Bugula neritina AB1)]|nr:30S ribosomal protein S9 [Rickettsiales bacterium (ex Bugula neritina AB1)]